MTQTPRKALIALSDEVQVPLWRAALEARGMDVGILATGAPVVRSALEDPALCAGGMLVASLERLAAEALEPMGVGVALGARAPRLEFAFAMERRIEVSSAERRFTQGCGASDLLPRLANPSPKDPAAHTAVAARMRAPGGVPRMDRPYLGKVYADCFVGRAAVDWLAREFSLGRDAAVALGQELLKGGVFHHVVKEHGFGDEDLFYRFAEVTPALEKIDLHGVLKRLWARDGLAIDTRRYRGKNYPACFVGSTVVDWLFTHYGLSREEAVTLGQWLLDLSLARHVVDEHPFVDGHFFYRFRRHEFVAK